MGNGRMVGGPKLPTVCSCVTRGWYKDGPGHYHVHGCHIHV